MNIRVVIVDDQELIRSGLRGIVAEAPDLTVVGEAANGRDGVDVVTATAPDVVLMDIRMPVMDGIEATRLITSTSRARVIIITTFDLDENVHNALHAGASGFLLKASTSQDLHTAIRVVAAGEALLAPQVTRRLITAYTDRAAMKGKGLAKPKASEKLRLLTGREREVLGLVAEGLNNAEIGVRLHITTGTAKIHVARLLTKFQARDRVQLVITAIHAGL